MTLPTESLNICQYVWRTEKACCACEKHLFAIIEVYDAHFYFLKARNIKKISQLFKD